MRASLLAAVCLVAGCLDAPPIDRSHGDGDDLLPPAADATDPDAAADLADAAAPACDTAFAVAYIDRLTVDPQGGTYDGVLVIEALGSTVNLDDLTEGPDDGIKVELELSQPAYEITPAGLVRGELAPAAENMILAAGLIDGDAWDASAPTFRLRFDPVAELQPPADVTADLFVGDSKAVLEFHIVYEPTQEQPVIPRRARRVESACGE